MFAYITYVLNTINRVTFLNSILIKDNCPFDQVKGLLGNHSRGFHNITLRLHIKCISSCIIQNLSKPITSKTFMNNMLSGIFKTFA